MKDKIDQLAKELSRLTLVETAFFNSIQDKDSLTPPQEMFVNKLYSRYCENKWRKSYDDRKRRIMKACAEFYVNNPPKFSALAARVLNDFDFIPTREQYREMCENKEARNFLEPDGATPLFSIGSLVRINHTADLHRFAAVAGKLAVVIRVRKDDQYIPPRPDLRFLYYVLPQGMGNTIMFLEKDLTKINLEKTNES